VRRDCWYDGKLLNISERFVVAGIDLRIFATFSYTAGVEPNAVIGRMLLIELARQTGQI
jgi:hypothetical protein